MIIMSLLLDKESIRIKRSDKRTELFIDKFLIISFIFTFSAIVIVQFTLTNQSIGTLSGAGNAIEGIPLGKEESLYSEGTMVLKLSGDIYDRNIKIMINGDVEDNFADNMVSIAVKNGDIVEIDGSEARGNARVFIVSVSENINKLYLNKSIEVEKGIKKLAAVKIN